MRLLLFFVLAFTAQAKAANVVLELKRDALVRGTMVLLADVATPEGSEQLDRSILTLPLGRAPLAGYMEQLSRAEVEAQLMRQAAMQGHQLSWRGAASVRIRTETVMLAGAQLVDAAKEQLQAEYGHGDGELLFEVATFPADVAIPAGEFVLRARKIGAQRLQGRVPVWVDVIVHGTVYRSVVVPVQVETGKHAPMPVVRGSKVRLVVAGRLLTVEVPAVAQADAALGQKVLVRPENGNGPVKARVSGPGEVRIDE